MTEPQHPIEALDPSDRLTHADRRGVAILFGALDVRVRRWRLACRGRFALAAGASSELRGALGKAMHGRPEFDALFAPGLAPGQEPRAMRGGSGAPRPFVCRGPEPRTLPADGGSVEVELVLFGTPSQAVTPWDDAIERAACDGFGRPRGQFRVEAATDVFGGTLADWVRLRQQQILVAPGTALLRVAFATPIWLKAGESKVLPSPTAVAVAALRRAEALAEIYGRGSAAAWDKSPVLDAAGTLEIHPLYAESFEERRGRRFSYRQRQKIPLDAVVGWFQGPVVPKLQEVFLAAELLHLGRSTGLGMGRVRVGAAEGEL